MFNFMPSYSKYLVYDLAESVRPQEVYATSFADAAEEVAERWVSEWIAPRGKDVAYSVFVKLLDHETAYEHGEVRFHEGMDYSGWFYETKEKSY